MPVYSTGHIEAGCVVVFPGQHGLAGGFEEQIAPLMASRGVAVFTASYASTPGGPRLTLGQARRFASEVVGRVESRCGPRYVVVGRSLGSMVAAYAVRSHRPVALLLEGASPSLAMAMRSVLKPVLGRFLVDDLIPLERLLSKNYSLWDALGAGQGFPVTIFQGTLDLQTPITDLTKPGAMPSWIEVVQVEGSDHQATWKALMPQYADRILGALKNGTSCFPAKQSMPQRQLQHAGAA